VSLNVFGSYRTVVLYEYIMLFIVSCMLPFNVALWLMFLRLVTLCISGAKTVGAHL